MLRYGYVLQNQYKDFFYVLCMLVSSTYRTVQYRSYVRRCLKHHLRRYVNESKRYCGDITGIFFFRSNHISCTTAVSRLKYTVYRYCVQQSTDTCTVCTSVVLVPYVLERECYIQCICISQDTRTDIAFLKEYCYCIRTVT